MQVNSVITFCYIIIITWNVTATSLPTTNEAALANSSAAKKPPGKINFYDPIQQHSSAIPDLNTSSGDKYALPSPKTGRASKQSDKTATNKQVAMHVIYHYG